MWRQLIHAGARFGCLELLQLGKYHMIRENLGLSDLQAREAAFGHGFTEKSWRKACEHLEAKNDN